MLYFRHGALNERQLRSVEMFLSRYPYVAYFSKCPNMDGLKKHDQWHEPDMGEGYVRKTQLWGMCEAPHGRLVFCYDPEDYQALIGQTDVLIDANPFETRIQDTRPRSIKQAEIEQQQKVREREWDQLRRLTFWERVRAVFWPLNVNPTRP